MALNVVATQKFLRKLRCAYTGQPVEVRMIAHGDKPPLYFSPDAYDPAAECAKTSEELFRRLGVRDGVAGAARDGAELVCPYTGRRMAVEADSRFGFRAVGGYSPSTPVSDCVEFARAMMTRGGVVPEDAPKPAPAPVRVALVEETEAPPETAGAPTDVAMEFAEKMTKERAPRRPRITVPAGVPA